MKKAFSYARISTTDQSKFSIGNQLEENQRLAERLEMTIAQEFIDNGQSAKNFDRPDWKALEAALNEHRDVKYIIVAKYDRFSRNAGEALMLLEKFEQKMGVRVLSAMEYFFIDPYDPMFFKIRSEFLINAEWELRVIRQRTQYGMRKAMKDGWYCNRPPWGYLRKRTPDKKPTLELDPEKAPVIKEMYDNALAGLTIQDIKKIAKAKGYTKKGNSAIQRVLTNCTYAGLIHLPPFKDEPETWVDGNFEGIVSKVTYWKVYEIVMSGQSSGWTTFNPDAPLKGVMFCDCHRPMTFAKSRGKMGKRYGYYKCPKCRGRNVNSEKFHDQFLAILQELSLPPLFLDHVEGMAMDHLKQKKLQNAKEKAKLKKELADLEVKLETIEERFALGEIKRKMYGTWSKKYQMEIDWIQSQINAIVASETTNLFKLKAELRHLEDMGKIWQESSSERKNEFAKIIFPQGFSKIGNTVRTPEIMNLFMFNFNNIKGLEIEKPVTPIGDFTGIPVSSPKGKLFELDPKLINFLKAL